MTNTDASLIHEKVLDELADIVRRSVWPDDWEVGKHFQIIEGPEVIPFNTEMEIARGQYQRMARLVDLPMPPTKDSLVALKAWRRTGTHLDTIDVWPNVHPCVRAACERAVT